MKDELYGRKGGEGRRGGGKTSDGDNCQAGGTETGNTSIDQRWNAGSHRGRENCSPPLFGFTVGDVPIEGYHRGAEVYCVSSTPIFATLAKRASLSRKQRNEGQ